MKFYFPCSNGICCYNDGKKSIAIVDSDGSKKVASFKTKNKVIFWNAFFVRGIQYFLCGIVALLSSFNLSLDLSNFENTKLSKSLSNIFIISAKYFFFLVTAAISFLLSFFLLGYAPAKLSFWIMGSSPNFYLRAFLIAVIKVIFIYLILLILRLLPSMQYFFKFNGATSQISDNLSKFGKKSKKNAQKSERNAKNEKFSHFSPLNFLNFIVFTLLFAIFMVSLISVNMGFWANLAINILIGLVCMGVSYEILLLLEKSETGRQLSLVTCYFVSAKPNITAEEIAKVAKLESERNESIESLPDGEVAMSTLITEMETKLESVGKYQKSDVEWIIATILNKNRAEIKLVRSVTEKDYRDILAATDRRSKGEPLSSIFGYVDFYGLRIDVNKKVLSPRMETELLVDEAIKAIKENNLKNVCDLCTGSGAIAIAIAKNCDAKVFGLDISSGALATAQANAKKAGVKVDFIESDLFEGLKKLKKFDIIVSNPPYIPSKDIESLDDEVKKYDPILALDGGQDGLDFYRKIINDAPKRLTKGGILMFEVGQGQAPTVRKMLKDGAFIDTHIIKDYNKIERIVYGKLRS